MTELGKLLQQTRKKKKYSLEQVNKLTRISQRYIKALEESDSSVFPAEVYHRSFLKNYAKFLGLNLDEVIKMYEQEKNGIQYDLFSDEEIIKQTSENKNIKRNKEKKQNSTETVHVEIKGKEESKIKKNINVALKKGSKRENINYENKIEEKVKNKYKKTEDQNLFITKLILVLVFCILFVGLLIIINVLFTGKKATQIKEGPEIASVDNVSDTNKEVSIETKKEITKQVLEIDAIKDCWIRVFSDGEQIFEGLLLSGQQQTCFADDNFTIKIGNIENLKISFNGNSVDTSVGAKNDKTNTLTFKKDI